MFGLGGSWGLNWWPPAGAIALAFAGAFGARLILDAYTDLYGNRRKLAHRGIWVACAAASLTIAVVMRDSVRRPLIGLRQSDNYAAGSTVGGVVWRDGYRRYVLTLDSPDEVVDVRIVVDLPFMLAEAPTVADQRGAEGLLVNAELGAVRQRPKGAFGPIRETESLTNVFTINALRFRPGAKVEVDAIVHFPPVPQIFEGFSRCPLTDIFPRPEGVDPDRFSRAGEVIVQHRHYYGTNLTDDEQVAYGIYDRGNEREMIDQARPLAPGFTRRSVSNVSFLAGSNSDIEVRSPITRR